MPTTIRATFDGTVLRPEHQLDLRTGATYLVTIGDETPSERTASLAEAEEYPLTLLGRLAVDMGVEDLAANHDWYAHGRIPDGPGDR